MVRAVTEYRTLGEFCAATADPEHDQAVEATLQWMVAELSREADERERIGATVAGLHFSAESLRRLVAEKADLIRQYRSQNSWPAVSTNSPDINNRPLSDDDLLLLPLHKIAAWHMHWTTHRRANCQCERVDEWDIDHGRRLVRTVAKGNILQPGVIL